MQLGNGRWETSLYNNRLQITQIGLGVTDSTQDLLKLEYGYGTSTQNNGSLRSQKISFNGLAQPFEQTYTYDDLNRLQSAEEKVSTTTTWKQTFAIDRYGNRRFDAANTTTLGSCTTAVCNPNINTSDNRFSSGQGYSYDQNGNVTQDAQGQRFGYDAENHQKEFFATGNGTSTPDATYSYDGEGKRVKKISSTETTVFVYNASGQLVAEYSTALATTPQVSYLTTDHLGSPRVVTNESGTVKDRKDYSAFGEESTSAQRSANSEYSAADQLHKNYTGYEKDGESGLEFAQARYYNPMHGRFTSVDPLTASASIRNPQTFNRYSYVLNSPYKFVDPLGLLSSSTGACGSSCPNSDGGAGERPGHDDVSGNFAEETAEQQTTDIGIAAAAIHEALHAQQAVSPSSDVVVPETDAERQQYNCMAWALGLTNVWIEPVYYTDGSRGGGYKETRNRKKDGDGDKTYLPMGEDGLTQLPPYSMVQTAKAYGAKEDIKVDGNKIKASSADETPDGYYKIAVFEGKDYKQTHVMRQDADGTWSSKNGAGERVTGIKDAGAYYKSKYSPGSDVKTTYLFRKTEKLGKR